MPCEAASILASSISDLSIETLQFGGLHPCSRELLLQEERNWPRKTASPATDDQMNKWHFMRLEIISDQGTGQKYCHSGVSLPR